jgi:hypothetical protein
MTFSFLNFPYTFLLEIFTLINASLMNLCNSYSYLEVGPFPSFNKSFLINLFSKN